MQVLSGSGLLFLNIISHCDHCLLCFQRIPEHEERPVSGAGNKALPFQSFKIPQTWKLIYWSTHITNWQQIKQLMVSQSLYSSGHQGFRSVSAKKLPWTTLQDKCNASKWPQIETLSVCLDSAHWFSRICLNQFCLRISSYHWTFITINSNAQQCCPALAMSQARKQVAGFLPQVDFLCGAQERQECRANSLGAENQGKKNITLWWTNIAIENGHL